MIPPLETERLDLVPFADGHQAAFHAIWGDPEVIWWGHHHSPEQSADGFARLLAKNAALPDGLGWSFLRLRSTGEIVGDVVLDVAPPQFGGVEIGWHLARVHWGHGYATEGAAPLLDQAWSVGLDEVIATIVPVNLPSVRVAERLGMRRRGPTIERSGLAHGVWVIGRPLP